jgi:hypothetical protein
MDAKVASWLERSKGNTTIDLEQEEFDRLHAQADEKATNVNTLIIKAIEQYQGYIPDRGIQYFGSDEKLPQSPGKILAIIDQLRKGVDWTLKLPTIQQKAVLDVQIGAEAMNDVEFLKSLTNDPNEEAFVRRTIRSLQLPDEQRAEIAKKQTIGSPLEMPIGFLETIAKLAEERKIEIDTFLKKYLNIGLDFESLTQRAMESTTRNLRDEIQSDGLLR